MWVIIGHIVIVFISFYLFCLSMAHVFMYKPDQQLLNQLKGQRNSFIFALLGIGVWYLLKISKTPERWFYPTYIVVFLLIASGSFFLMTEWI